MLKSIGDFIGGAIKNVGPKLSDIFTIGDPKTFLAKKAAESIFTRKMGADGNIMSTAVTPPRFGTKNMGFYTPGMAKRSNMMGMQGKTVDPETLQNEWFVRLRRYYFNKKYYS